MKTVKFTEMKKGSKEDYELLAEYLSLIHI